MVSERDIFAAAKLLIKQHGETAWFEACLRCDAFIAKGDIEGERVWKRVLKALEALSDGPRGQGETLN